MNILEDKKDEPCYTKSVIPVGPVYPALKEPVHFKVTLNREKIVDVDLRLGFVHRGIEKLAQNRNLVQTTYLVERICGICSHSHSTCFVQAIEEIGGIELSERASYIRTILSEMERLHSHLLWIGVAAYGIGFDTAFMYSMRVREKIMDWFERITGNRVHHSINTFGGVRNDLTPDSMNDLQAFMKEAEKICSYLLDIIHSKTVEKRLSDTGILSKDVAKMLCVVGPTARASGVETDVRKDDPYAAYGDLKKNFSKIVKTKGDALSRAEVRVLEMFESVNLIQTALDQLPSGQLGIDNSLLKVARKIPEGEAISRIEAPRGELLHFVKSNGKNGLNRLKIRTPTLANILCLKNLLIGREVADIPVIVSSIDPCMSCADR